MDLILGDLPSVSSTPPPVCLVFSCRGICSRSGHAVRLCFGKHVNDARFACSLCCVLPCCPWICPPTPPPLFLSLTLSLPHTPSTVRAIGGVCLPFLLNNGETRWRAPIRRLCSTRVDHFSRVSDHQRDLSGYTLKCSATPQSVNIPLQKRVAFESAGSACMFLRLSVMWESLGAIWGLMSAPALRIQRPLMDWRKKWTETEGH